MYLEETIQVKKKERKKKMLAVDVFTAVIDYFFTANIGYV
jgi:hypothetical protein